MSSEGLQVVFKITFEEEKQLRRCSFPQLKDITYSALYSKLSNLYNMTDFRIRYIDEENDLITIDNELDLQECFSYLLKINKDNEKLVVRLTLSQENSLQKSKENKESVINEDDTSNSNPPQTVDKTENPDETENKVETENKIETENKDNQNEKENQDDQNEKENQDETDGFGLEKAINDGITNFQNMIQNLVTNMSTTLESDLNNLHNTLQQPIQQAVNTINTINNDIKSDNNDDNDCNCNKKQELNNSSLSQQSSSNNNNVKEFNETEQIIKREQIISQGPVIHDGVYCDCCKNIICGMRWKCLACPNYDLCQICKSKQPTIHNHESNHEFKPIPYPPNYYSSNYMRTKHSAICDFCESQIYGTRHKCINCPDFDLCNSCISLAPTQHPNHTFMPIYRPGEPEIKILDSVFHPGIRCDGCEKLIVGVRFKCTNCPNFDFCGNCEASPHNTHNDSHIFLKVKLPVSIPIPSEYSLLPNYYVCDINFTTNESTKRQVDSKEKEVSFINNNSNNDTKEESSFYQSVTPSPQSSIKSETITSRAPILLYEQSSSPPTPSIQVPKQEVQPYLINKTDESQNDNNSSLEQKLESLFVEDINFPDGTTLVPRAQFIKKWKMENIGNIAWPKSTALKFVGGDKMFSETPKSSDEFHVGLVEVGKIIEVSAELQAPSEPGKYISYWRLVDGEGNNFGHRLWCDINVEDDDSSMTASSMIFPVLKNAQVSTDKQDSVAKSMIEKFFDKERLEKSLEAISSQSTTTNSNNDKNNDETKAISEPYYDSDVESDISSLSSLENSQDYYFVEKEDHLLEDEKDEKETVKENVVKEVVFDTDDIEKNSKNETENQSKKSNDQ